MKNRNREVCRGGHAAAPFALILVAVTLSSGARAQPTPESAPAPTAPTAPSPAENSAASESSAPLSNDAIAKALEESKKAHADAQAKIEELTSRADAAEAAVPEDEGDDKIKVYGFMDVGVQRVFVSEDRALAAILNSANATSFVIGNLTTYLDVQPMPGWRGLLEVRFTNAPHGEVNSFGGIAGTFKRQSTYQFDPHSATVNAPMWGGYVVIERAQIDWTDNELFKLRVGSFFTPFGIWNVDHGTPTLISLVLPQVVALGAFPIRQTGIMLYGTLITGSWELGYHATLTNGRQELSNFAFDDNRGFGGRLFANRETGEFTVKIGVSGYTGRVRDKQVDVAGISPITLKSKSTFDYREWVLGADISIDKGPFRFRTEGAVSHTQFEAGKHKPASGLGDPGGQQPNRYILTGYVLAAYQLPFLGLEPFAIVDALHGPFGLGDTGGSAGGGFNVRISPAIIIKAQANYAAFFNLRDSSKANATLKASESNNVSAFARLVLVY